MNLMRDRAESQRAVGPFDTREEAIEFHESEKAAKPWHDEGPSGFTGETVTFTKTFKPGSVMEWLNPLEPSEIECSGPFGHGVFQWDFIQVLERVA